MSWLLALHVIRLFNFYLILVFLVTTYARLRDYVKVLDLVRRVPGRWPRLFHLVRQHWNIFLTGSSFLPLLSSGGLVFGHTIAHSYFIQTHWDGMIVESTPRLVKHYKAVAVTEV